MSDDVSRFYTQAEVSGEDQTWLDGSKDRLVRLRFMTLNVSDTGESEGKTEWVTFTLHGLEHLSVQLAATVETIKRWTPGHEPEALGLSVGVVARNVKG